ncbi:NADH-quinone oxidoreductase subunit C [Sphingobacterium wenxiniae]|uniref:NADH-quinone oxidoreductase subunit C n=1 Tax=Sphingobacterium wenxiniae TaxID=683125 RepID=A0A1I6ULJ9_9SPHI|nr:NADH-quinone oxidoreductase subunit C [Sphingobacterium wenxiniae]SFT02356.1 NADH dehydrogenase subunit C [Sphingobacterium wenxiniae]
MDKLDNQLILSSLQEKFGQSVKPLGEPHGLLTVEVDKEAIIEVLSFVKDDETLRFNFLTDITAVHYPKQEREFCVVYHVHNMLQNVRLRLKVFLQGPEPSVASATSVWNGANWMERETYDFFGVVFEGHPDLRRILNMDELEVFPMRKEYPLEDPNRVDKKDFYFGR